MSGVSYNFGATDKEIAERRAREKAAEERAAEERKEGEMLVDIGKHCARCHQKTFLPFVCSKCGLSFCTEHRLDHNCQGASGAQTTASQDLSPLWFVSLFPLPPSRSISHSHLTHTAPFAEELWTSSQDKVLTTQCRATLMRAAPSRRRVSRSGAAAPGARQRSWCHACAASVARTRV